MRGRVFLLVFVTAGIAMAEAAALRSAGYVSVLGLAPQVTAPPPYGIFHDMRWLFVYNSSWLSFAWETAALVGFRTLLSTGGGLLVIGHASGDAGNVPVPPPMRAQAVHGKPRLAVLFVAGYDSSFHGAHPVVTSPGMTYEIYSYRGLDGGGVPRPYSGLDTHQSLARSARMLAAQVRALHARTGLPVGLAADSEGTLVARAYLMRARHPPVDALVLFSPLIRPARVYYPPLGGGPGFGYVSGLELQGLLDALEDVGGPPMSVMEPFVRSIVDNAPLYRNNMLCATPGLRSMAVLSLASATVAPPGPMSDIGAPDASFGGPICTGG